MNGNWTFVNFSFFWNGILSGGGSHFPLIMRWEWDPFLWVLRRFPVQKLLLWLLWWWDLYASSSSPARREVTWWWWWWWWLYCLNLLYSRGREKKFSNMQASRMWIGTKRAYYYYYTYIIYTIRVLILRRKLDCWINGALFHTRTLYSKVFIIWKENTYSDRRTIYNFIMYALLPIYFSFETNFFGFSMCVNLFHFYSTNHNHQAQSVSCSSLTWRATYT